MSRRTIFGISMACVLAGMLFFAGCEKEKNKEAELVINESNYDKIPLKEYVIGTWTLPYVLGESDQHNGTQYVDTMVFTNDLYYNSCSQLNRKYKCSNISNENGFYPFRIKRVAADTMLVYGTNFCHSFSQVEIDLPFIRSK